MAADQTSQRRDAIQKTAIACRQWLDAYHVIQDIAERMPFLGTLVDEDFTSGGLEYMDAATFGLISAAIAPNLKLAYDDAGHGGQMKQILNQVAGTITGVNPNG